MRLELTRRCFTREVVVRLGGGVVTRGSCLSRRQKLWNYQQGGGWRLRLFPEPPKALLQILITSQL